MYLFNSLAKSCTLTLKYSYTINRNNIFKILSDIKKLLKAFGQFFGHDHAILINDYQRNYDVILSKYVTSK